MLDLKSINIGIIVYVVLYIVGIFIQRPLQGANILASDNVHLFATLYFPLVLLVSGYVTGRLAKHNRFFSGSIVGLASIVVNLIGATSYFGIEALSLERGISVFSILFPLTLAGVGGALAQYWPKQNL